MNLEENVVFSEGMIGSILWKKKSGNIISVDKLVSQKPIKNKTSKYLVIW